ncbi:MAG: ABC transporter substrate-binding protein [Steroidobacteraceae bacterium]
MNAGRGVAAAALLTLFVSWSPAASEPPGDAGESIYRRGMTASGAPIQALRDSGGESISGASAACANCHRRSGLGTTEGRIAIPPVTGRYLFQPRTPGRDQADLPYVAGMHPIRDPYTDATLARAIRAGLDSEGKPLGYLMPRFTLSDADMAALIDYLKKLDVTRVPGVTDTTLNFATIITPDADPLKRRGVLDVMEHYFADKNLFPFPPSPHIRSSSNTAYSKSMYMANRRWQLHVWELTGPPSSWGAELEQRLQRDPVLAVVSGLGGSDWAPVHDFCERARLPCLFPNVEVPVVAEGEFYSLYFSQGVLLEAALIAKTIAEAGGEGPIKSVQQIYRSGDSGEPAAHAAAAALKKHDIAVYEIALPAGATGRGVAEALGKAPRADALLLWLRADDLAVLGDAAVAPSSVFMSGLMGGLEHAPLPVGWRPRVRLAYPFDLPDSSRVRVAFPIEWFKIRHIPLVAEQAQVDTYIACGLLAETINHMADTLGREYLVERMEEMLEHRVMTGYYPRLTMAEGQRFASKGGFLLRFAGPEGVRLRADGGWVVP